MALNVPTARNGNNARPSRPPLSLNNNFGMGGARRGIPANVNRPAAPSVPRSAGRAFARAAAGAIARAALTNPLVAAAAVAYATIVAPQHLDLGLFPWLGGAGVVRRPSWTPPGKMPGRVYKYQRSSPYFDTFRYSVVPVAAGYYWTYVPNQLPHWSHHFYQDYLGARSGTWRYGPSFIRFPFQPLGPKYGVPPQPIPSIDPVPIYHPSTAPSPRARPRPRVHRQLRLRRTPHRAVDIKPNGRVSPVSNPKGRPPPNVREAKVGGAMRRIMAIAVGLASEGLDLLEIMMDAAGVPDGPTHERVDAFFNDERYANMDWGEFHDAFVQEQLQDKAFGQLINDFLNPMIDNATSSGSRAGVSQLPGNINPSFN